MLYDRCSTCSLPQCYALQYECSSGISDFEEHTLNTVMINERLREEIAIKFLTKIKIFS